MIILQDFQQGNFLAIGEFTAVNAFRPNLMRESLMLNLFKTYLFKELRLNRREP